MALVEPPALTDPRIAAARSGDRRALEAVLREHLVMLQRLVGRLVRDPSEAEDIVQNALVGAITSFPGFRGDAQVSTWLARIAMRQVQDHWRRRARRPATVHDDAADIATGEQVDARADARRRLARLDHHLAAIGARKRLAFVLHVIEGKPVAEVAALMGATQTATRTRVMWARRALIARLKKDPTMADLVEEVLR